MAIEKDCPDATEAAGYEYDQCIAHASMIPEGYTAEDYCACIASTYSKLYESNKTGPGSDTFIELKGAAVSMCENPALAPQLYPDKKKSSNAPALSDR
jgi:hypothetical protein